MIGLRIGPRVGPHPGPVVGVNADRVASLGGPTTQTVSVVDSADPVITGGDAFAYMVQYTNTGSNDATTVSVAVTLDSSLAYVSSSGTGWSIGVAGQVVTCTRAAASPGAAPTITINVTTGGSALTAATSAQATASNATTANGSQNTTVNLVSKDATSGIYCPASNTEWTNFIARKGLSISNPSALYLLQEASGNPADSIGSFTLTFNAGTGSAYQQAVSGWTRQAITTTDGGTANWNSTSASLPDPASASCTIVTFGKLLSTPGTVHVVQSVGSATICEARVTTTPQIRIADGANTSTGTSNPSGAVRPWVLKYNFTGSNSTLYTDQEHISPTFAAAATKKITLGNNGATDCAFAYLYAFIFMNSAAEISDANVKALLQAMGWTIPWS